MIDGSYKKSLKHMSLKEKGLIFSSRIFCHGFFFLSKRAFYLKE